jgi:hypothetical protein
MITILHVFTLVLVIAWSDVYSGVQVLLALICSHSLQQPAVKASRYQAVDISHEAVPIAIVHGFLERLFVFTMSREELIVAGSEQQSSYRAVDWCNGKDL